MSALAGERIHEPARARRVPALRHCPAQACRCVRRWRPRPPGCALQGSEGAPEDPLHPPQRVMRRLRSVFQFWRSRASPRSGAGSQEREARIPALVPVRLSTAGRRPWVFLRPVATVCIPLTMCASRPFHPDRPVSGPIYRRRRALRGTRCRSSLRPAARSFRHPMPRMEGHLPCSWPTRVLHAGWPRCSYPCSADRRRGIPRVLLAGPETVRGAVATLRGRMSFQAAPAPKASRRAASISSRMRRMAGSRPVKIASPIRKWPMFSSITSGIAATGRTVS